ncbi:response regulator transcription factor [Thermobrachium celere]|uniref:Stage 0 sporulation protein A homolog n=1 Tax=Thermobrachium celere DSM 8682 TaxID=941824 RepID=R7RTI7_9CLOT|nr:response regulator transcription factor [Thermobrachium celere]CDF58540.1 Two-component response regulator vanR [Thermobrachium celere DSM 8682]
MSETILIVDDEKEIRDIIEIYLKNEGYKVIHANDGIEALNILKETTVDLVITDIMMKGLDGISLCNEIRKNYYMPIIILSAKDEEKDKLLGLSSGAEDYITKPFSIMELVARVKSQLRRYKRYNNKNDDRVIEIGDLKINCDTRQVFVKDREVTLTSKEFGILELLARNRGIVMSIPKIYETVWGEEFFKADNTVMVHITNLRQKIEEDPKRPVYIKTVWGVGYKI